MKILKQGKPPSEKLYRAECHNCHSEFEFQKFEAKHESGDQREMSSSYDYIVCQVCQSWIQDKSWKAVPEIIQSTPKEP